MPKLRGELSFPRLWRKQTCGFVRLRASALRSHADPLLFGEAFQRKGYSNPSGSTRKNHGLAAIARNNNPLAFVLLVQMPVRYESWFTREDVKRLTCTCTDTNELGRGYNGRVYLGRLAFHDRTKKAVAVKIFHFNLTRKHVTERERLIKRLANAGVRIPKTGFICHPQLKRWVQVQELFGSPRREKLLGVVRAETPEAAEDVARQVARVNNAGFFYPCDAGGTLLKKGGQTTFYLFDFDLMVSRARPGSYALNNAARLSECLKLPHPTQGTLNAIASLNELYQIIPPEHLNTALEAFYRELEDNKLAELLKASAQLNKEISQRLNSRFTQRRPRLQAF